MRKIIYILLSIGITVAMLSVLMCSESLKTVTVNYKPMYIEGYTYGDFDELRIKMVFQVSDSDDVFGLPVGDFEYDGQMYHLICLDKTDESDLDYGAKEKIDYNENLIFYTATFGC